MIYALAAGLILGTLGTWFVQRDELRFLRKELALATDRLAHARIERGAEIPPRPVEVEPVRPLPPALVDCVTQWDTAESRAVEEAKIRQWLAEGWGQDAILRQYGAGA